MAPYFYDPLMDKEKDQGSPQGIQLSSASSTMNPAGQPQEQGQSGGAPKGIARFQNLDSYLNNNNAQAAGQKFGDKVEGEVDQAKSTMDTAANQFKNTVNASGQVASQDQINAAVADPMKADANQFAGWRDTEYKGPKGLADDQAGWNQYWGAAQNANTTAKLAGKESGRFALLDKYYGRPAYNFGEKSLDNLLIQRGGGLNDVKAIQDKAAGLNTYGANQSKELAATAAQRAGQVEQTRNAARSAVGLGANGQVQGGALGSLQDQVTQRAKDWNSERDRQYGNLTADLSDDQVNADTLSALRLSGDENLYDIDLKDSRYLSKNPQDATVGTVATGDDYNRYLALSKLAGIDPTFLTEAGRAGAGTAGSKVGFNKELFDQDVAAKKATVDRELGDMSADKGLINSLGSISRWTPGRELGGEVQSALKNNNPEAALAAVQLAYNTIAKMPQYEKSGADKAFGTYIERLTKLVATKTNRKLGRG